MASFRDYWISIVTVILLIMIFSKIQIYYKHLFQANQISPTNHIFLKTFNSEFQEIKVWFTDQTSKPLEVDDKINLTLITK